MKTQKRRLFCRRKIFNRIALHRHRHNLRRKQLKKKRNRADAIEFHQWAYYRKLAKDVRSFKDSIGMFMPQSLRYLIECDKGDSLEKSCDHCRDTLVENISDDGINLYVEEKYMENIKSVVEADKKEMLSLLFEFKG